eukprot:1153609-Pelagomonas_calceolata.AAC.5
MPGVGTVMCTSHCCLNHACARSAGCMQHARGGQLPPKRQACFTCSFRKGGLNVGRLCLVAKIAVLGTRVLPSKMEDFH